MEDVIDSFPIQQFAEELLNARENLKVGTAIWFENYMIRVWDLRLEPGERLPFHCHQNTYFWVCEQGGRGIDRQPKGKIRTHDYSIGEVTWHDLTPQQPLIHDLENVGDSILRFQAVELLKLPANWKNPEG